MTRRDPNIPLRALLTAVALSVVAPGAAIARQDETPPAEPATPPAEEGQNESAPPPALPDLDELLGLEGDDDDDDAGDRVPTQDELELERRLNAEQAEDAFKDAVRQMGEVADALRVARDPGLRTQRVQEDILNKLDLLIEQAEQNPSSSSSQSQSQSQPRPQQRQQQQQQQSQQSQSSNSQGDNTSEMTPPGGQSGQLRDLLDAAQAAWGSLPPRVRDVLLQGSSDRFSTLYESMTEEYYRRLAEEGRRP
ncbi:MAG: hypothetical protein ACF8QF_10800 [Phycisphaerales bacterium]